MLTLKQIKKDIQFNLELSDLIDVLKDVASSQFRHLQTRKEYSLRLGNSLNDFFAMVDLIKSKHPFILPPPSLPSAIVMVTSDEGFLGALNAQVIDAAFSLRKREDSLIVLGERGAHFLEELKESFLYFPGIGEDVEYDQVHNLRDYLIQQYLRKKFSKVVIVYPKFVSFTTHDIKIEQLLPHLPNIPALPAGRQHLIPSTHSEILVEPFEGRIIDYLIRVWLSQRMFDIFWESKLSELSSRVVHLEGSSQSLDELRKKLHLFYFRTLHSISDKNIREVIASRLIK